MGKTIADARAEVGRMVEMVEAACAGAPTRPGPGGGAPPQPTVVPCSHSPPPAEVKPPRVSRLGPSNERMNLGHLECARDAPRALAWLPQ